MGECDCVCGFYMLWFVFPDVRGGFIVFLQPGERAFFFIPCKPVVRLGVVGCNGMISIDHLRLSRSFLYLWRLHIFVFHLICPDSLVFFSFSYLLLSCYIIWMVIDIRLRRFRNHLSLSFDDRFHGCCIVFLEMRLVGEGKAYEVFLR